MQQMNPVIPTQAGPWQTSSRDSNDVEMYASDGTVVAQGIHGSLYNTRQVPHVTQSLQVSSAFSTRPCTSIICCITISTILNTLPTEAPTIVKLPSRPCFGSLHPG